MKKRIALWLLMLERKLHPATIDIFEQEEKYEPKVCAKAYSIDKACIRRYKRKKQVKSTREALRLLTNETLAQAKEDVLSTIEARLMKQRVYKKNGKTVVEVKVNCYVKKEEM